MGWMVIRDDLASECGMGNIPYIRVNELIKKDNTLILEHVFDGRELDISYAKETIKYIQSLWGYTVKLITMTKDNKKFTIVCNDKKNISILDT